MAKNNYTLHVPLSVNGIKHLKENFIFISNNLPRIRNLFMQRSLDFIEQRAKSYIRATTGGSSWYQLTNELENSFMKDPCLGTLINYCSYSAFVEYGTGMVGKGTHPLSIGYQYDVNKHGDDGWFFFDDEGNIHWTKGMKAHRFMYDAVNDYYVKGECNRIFNEVVAELIGGRLK